MPAIVRRASRSAAFSAQSASYSSVLAALLGALVAAQPRVGAAHLAERREVALGVEPDGGIVEAAVSASKTRRSRGDEGVEVVGRDQLVLRAVDELDEARASDQSVPW